MKKVIGVILSIIFTAVFLAALVYVAGLKVVLLSLGLTVLIVGAVMLCVYLLYSEK